MPPESLGQVGRRGDWLVFLERRDIGDLGMCMCMGRYGGVLGGALGGGGSGGGGCWLKKSNGIFLLPAGLGGGGISANLHNIHT